MKIVTSTIILLSILLCSSVASQEAELPDSFKDYQKIVVKTNHDAKDGFIYIPKDIEYKLITKKQSLSENDVVHFKIAEIQFEIFYGQGPSAGGLFTISAEFNSKKFIKAIVAEKIFISNVGNLYTESRYGFYYNKKRKFIIDKNGISEKAQPFYLINLPCNVNENLKLMSERCLTGDVIATIPKGMSVHVLLVEETVNDTCSKCENFLVSTSFGLVGWVCTNPGHIINGPPPQLNCLRYVGP